MSSIRRAVQHGDLAELDRLLEEDGRRLNTQTDYGETPLTCAAMHGRDAVVARLLALGADVGLRDRYGNSAAHRACYGKHWSTLTLLLDAGAPFNARENEGWTPLMLAAEQGAARCVAVLVDRGGDALELDAVENEHGWTALHLAAIDDRLHLQILPLLLDAGANPTIRDSYGDTPLDVAQRKGIALLEAAIAEPQRPRYLLKARDLLDAALAISEARKDAADKGEPPAVQREQAVAVAPAYLKRRVAEGRALPAVEVVEGQGHGESEEKVVACLKYALGLEGGTDFAAEGGGGDASAPQGMVREVMIELCELLVPKWDRAHM